MNILGRINTALLRYHDRPGRWADMLVINRKTKAMIQLESKKRKFIMAVLNHHESGLYYTFLPMFPNARIIMTIVDDSVKEFKVMERKNYWRDFAEAKSLHRLA